MTHKKRATRKFHRFMKASAKMAAAVVIGVTFGASCGSGPQGNILPIQFPSYPNGSYFTGTPEQFRQNCLYSGGQIYQVSGVDVCKSDIVRSSGGQVSAYLSPNQPYGGMVTGYSLRAGDKLSITTQGYYAYDCFFSCSSSSQIDMNGSQGGVAQPLTNGGMQAGFVISDGATVTFVGRSKTLSVTTDSLLRVGVNYSRGTMPNFMMNVGVSSIRITRCMDATGKTYSCS